MSEENLHRDNAAEIVMRLARRAVNAVIHFVVEVRRVFREADDQLFG